MNDCLPKILSAITHGDEHAFAQLYHNYHKRLVAFSKTIVHSNELAEEVVEDVFIKIWRNRQHLQHVNNLTVYLYVATKNGSLNCIAKKAKELTFTPFDGIDFEFDHPAANPCDLMITNEMHVRMKQAIDALPPRCKMIFKLVREDGLKYKEVATVLNIAVNTIDAQMAIAVKRISEALHITKPIKFSSSKKV